MAQVSKINQLSIGNLVASGTKKATSTQSSFSDIMSSSTSSKQQDTNGTHYSDSVKTSKAKLEEKSSTFKKTEKIDTDTSKDVAAEAVPDETLNVENVSETLSDEVAETVDALKEQIAEILSISKEELDKLMAESGLTVMDLLQPEVLKDLVLQVNGSNEQTDLLTNESMCNQLTELLNTVEEFMQSTDMEQFAVACQSLETKDYSSIMKAQDSQPVKNTDNPNPVEDVDEEVSVKETVKEAVITVQKEVTSEGEENTSSRNDSKEETDSKNSLLNQFVQNLSDSVNETGEVTVESLERTQQMQEIVDQVVERIKVTLTQDTTSMDLQLNPENLGKVNVSVVSKNGEMTATFTVENQLAKEALESQMTVLRDNLGEQGIKVDAIEVTVAQHGFSQNEFSDQSQQQFQNQTKRNNNSARMHEEEDMTEETEDESVEPVITTGTVDFSA